MRLCASYARTHFLRTARGSSGRLWSVRSLATMRSSPKAARCGSTKYVFASVPTKAALLPCLTCAPDGEHGVSAGASNRRRGHPRASRRGIHRKDEIEKKKKRRGRGGASRSVPSRDRGILAEDRSPGQDRPRGRCVSAQPSVVRSAPKTTPAPDRQPSRSHPEVIPQRFRNRLERRSETDHIL